MKITRKTRYAALWLSSAVAAPSASAAIHALADFTRPAGEALVSTPIDFVPTAGTTLWSGAPPNAINSQDSLYLTTTVSWTANANIGTFSAAFYQNDAGGAPRWGFGTVGSGFGVVGGNVYGAVDPDGAGPATASPAIAAVDKATITSVTLVFKVNQIQAATTPGGDFWFTDTSLQSAAAGFMWIDPNLAATEASQPTNIAQWRSGNLSYQGVRFATDTDAVDLNFTNIRLYTGADTPFSVVPEPSTVLLGGLGLLTLLRRRRNA